MGQVIDLHLHAAHWLVCSGCPLPTSVNEESISFRYPWSKFFIKMKLFFVYRRRNQRLENVVSEEVKSGRNSHE